MRLAPAVDARAYSSDLQLKSAGIYKVKHEKKRERAVVLAAKENESDKENMSIFEC